MIIRLAWSILAVLDVRAAVWQLLSPIGDYSLSCSKTGQLYESGVAAEATCDTTMIGSISSWSVASVVLLVAAPPVVAAMAKRVWMSWISVVLLVFIGVGGVVNWTSFWLILAVCAFPMAFVALIIAGLHLGIILRSARHNNAPDSLSSNASERSDTFAGHDARPISCPPRRGGIAILDRVDL